MLHFSRLLSAVSEFLKDVCHLIRKLFQYDQKKFALDNKYRIQQHSIKLNSVTDL